MSMWEKEANVHLYAWHTQQDQLIPPDTDRLYDLNVMDWSCPWQLVKSQYKTVIEMPLLPHHDKAKEKAMETYFLFFISETMSVYQ